MISRRLLKKTVNQDRFRDLMAREAWTEDEKKEVLAYPGFGAGRSDFFTPEVVCDFMARLALATLPDGAWDVLEPAAGTGRLACHVQRINPGHRIRMYELSCQYVQACRRLLPSAEVFQGDAVELFSKEERLYDLVIANPPFGRDKAMGPHGAEGFFLKEGLKRLKPDGVMISLVPDGILSIASAAPLRKSIMDQYRLLAVISLPPETFVFSGTGVKTSVLMIKNQPPTPEDKVSFLLSESVGWDSSGRPRPCDLDRLLAWLYGWLLERNLIANLGLVGQLRAIEDFLPAGDQKPAEPVIQAPPEPVAAAGGQLTLF